MKIEELVDAYCPLLDRIQKESIGITYSAHFLEPNIDTVSKKEGAQVLEEIRKVYLLGILERAHLASITSMARTNRWLKGANNAIKENNALLFSAALRGFLESAADAFDVMRFLPIEIEKLFPYLYLVFNDSPDVKNTMLGLEELEGRLIHYTYAKRQSRGTTPSSGCALERSGQAKHAAHAH